MVLSKVMREHFMRSFYRPVKKPDGETMLFYLLGQASYVSAGTAYSLLRIRYVSLPVVDIFLDI
jgi:hypothetical protein